MSVEGEVLSFTDNWSYLKAELAWLDRVLMRAVARHREVEREVARVAKNNTDRATSHWWRGFIVLDSAKGVVKSAGMQVSPVSIIPWGVLAIA